jgi:hypothetical protein
MSGHFPFPLYFLPLGFFPLLQQHNPVLDGLQVVSYIHTLVLSLEHVHAVRVLLRALRLLRKTATPLRSCWNLRFSDIVKCNSRRIETIVVAESFESLLLVRTWRVFCGSLHAVVISLIQSSWFGLPLYIEFRKTSDWI